MSADSVVPCGRGRYAFTCVICRKPGVGTVPLANTHIECKLEARRRADAKFKAKKKRKA